MACARNKRFAADLTLQEGFRRKSSFMNKMKYGDEHANAETTVITTNDDISFRGAVASMRIKYKSLVNYQSGFAVISIPRDAKDQYDQRDFEYCALLDLSSFLAFAGNPSKLADDLERNGRRTVADWLATNEHRTPETRIPVTWYGDIARYSWRSRRGEETSVMEYQLSSYNFTMHPDDELCKPGARLRMGLGDLKFLIKLRTTAGIADMGPDKSSRDEDGLHSDGYGYNVSLVHVLGMLRSLMFERLIADTKRDVRNLDPLPIWLSETTWGEKRRRGGGEQQSFVDERATAEEAAADHGGGQLDAEVEAREE